MTIETENNLPSEPTVQTNVPQKKVPLTNGLFGSETDLGAIARAEDDALLAKNNRKARNHGNGESKQKDAHNEAQAPSQPRAVYTINNFPRESLPGYRKNGPFEHFKPITKEDFQKLVDLANQQPEQIPNLKPPMPDKPHQHLATSRPEVKPAEAAHGPKPFVTPPTNKVTSALEFARNAARDLQNTPDGTDKQFIANRVRDIGRVLNDHVTTIDVTDTKIYSHFDHQKFGGQIVKDVDAVSAAMNKHDAKLLQQAKETMYNDMLKGMMYTAGDETPLSPTQTAHNGGKKPNPKQH